MCGGVRVYTECVVGVGCIQSVQWHKGVYRVYNVSRVYTRCTVGVYTLYTGCTM